MEQLSSKVLPSGSVSSAVLQVGGHEVVLSVIRRPEDPGGEPEADPSPAQLEPVALLEELVARIARLNRLIGAGDKHGDASRSAEEPAAASRTVIDLPRRPATGFTLKAVSRRTGIPAATLRTWERRYGFLCPERSPGGYRVYGELEIARIEQIKYLLGQGYRIGAAMAAVTGAADRAAASERQKRSG